MGLKSPLPSVLLLKMEITIIQCIQFLRESLVCSLLGTEKKRKKSEKSKQIKSSEKSKQVKSSRKSKQIKSSSTPRGKTGFESQGKNSTSQGSVKRKRQTHDQGGTSKRKKTSNKCKWFSKIVGRIVVYPFKFCRNWNNYVKYNRKLNVWSFENIS